MQNTVNTSDTGVQVQVVCSWLSLYEHFGLFYFIKMKLINYFYKVFCNLVIKRFLTLPPIKII